MHFIVLRHQNYLVTFLLMEIFHCFKFFMFTDKVVMNSFVKLLKRNYYRICVEYEYKGLNDNTQLFTKRPEINDQEVQEPGRSGTG